MKKLLCLFLLMLAGCVEQPSSPLIFGAVTWPGYEPAYVARELGYLNTEQVHLAEFTNTTEVLRAFRNGKLHVAGLTLDEALGLRHDIPDLQVFLVADISNGADMLMARPGIKNLGQLRGKRIGVEKTALGVYFLNLILREAGLSSRDIRIVSLPLDEQVQAYRAGALDAVVTFGVNAGKLQKAGAENIFDSSRLPGKIVDTLAIRAPDVQARKVQLHGFIQAWFRALNDIRHNHLRTYPYMAKREQTQISDIAATLRGLQLADKQSNLLLLTGKPAPLLDSSNEVHRYMKQAGLTTGGDDLSQFINPLPITRTDLD